MTAKQQKTKAARPDAAGLVDPKQRIKDYICDKIAEGVNLREICREPDMPAWRTVYDWMDADEKFAAAIASARDIGAHAIACQSLEIVDQEPERDPATGRIDPASVAHQKLRAEHRLKLLAKWSPKLYGDKITQEVTGNDGGPVAHVVLTPADYKAARSEMMKGDDV